MVAKLRELVTVLRERTWLSPVSAEEMNHRDRWLADQIEALLTEEAATRPASAETLDSEPVHGWFELTYAQYLTIPRSVLQSMPHEWQARFVQCLEQLDEAINWRPESGTQYWVRLQDEKRRYVHDPFMDYQRGRRRIPLNPEVTTRSEALEASKEQ